MLFAAAGYGTPTNITALLRAGANVNARNKGGKTPLHEAAFHGTFANVTALLKGEANAKARAISSDRTTTDKSGVLPRHG